MKQSGGGKHQSSDLPVRPSPITLHRTPALAQTSAAPVQPLLPHAVEPGSRKPSCAQAEVCQVPLAMPFAPSPISPSFCVWPWYHLLQEAKQVRLLLATVGLYSVTGCLARRCQCTGRSSQVIYSNWPTNSNKKRHIYIYILQPQMLYL